MEINDIPATDRSSRRTILDEAHPESFLRNAEYTVEEAGHAEAEVAESVPEADGRHSSDWSDNGSDHDDQATAVEADFAAVTKRIDDLSFEVSVLGDQLRTALEDSVVDQLATLKEMTENIRQLRATITEMAERGPGQDPSAAFTATAQLTALTSDIKSAKKKYKISGAWARIWAALKRIAPRLWSLVSHLVKVTQWSVTGQLGTGVLGLAQASVSVTFG